MTPVFIRPIGYERFCRLLTVGVTRHVTACRASIAADEPVILTATVPPIDLFCGACRFDLHERPVTIDLRPHVREIGMVADLEVE